MTISKNIHHKTPTTIPARLRIVDHHPDEVALESTSSLTPDPSGHLSEAIE
jgi:hypothetical protein